MYYSSCTLHHTSRRFLSSTDEIHFALNSFPSVQHEASNTFFETDPASVNLSIEKNLDTTLTAYPRDIGSLPSDEELPPGSPPRKLRKVHESSKGIMS